jgi:hypothetical protein
MEKLTGEIIESHLMSFIEVHSEVQPDGVTRWAWVLSPMAGEAYNRQLEERELMFEFKSFEAARNYAFGWIRRNRPGLERAAVQEAKDGIHYRATRA